MMMKIIQFPFLLLIFLSSCKKDIPNEECKVDCNSNEELIFQTGFESPSVGIPSDEIQYFTGQDDSVSAPNNWSTDLDNHPNIGDFSIQYQGGDTTQRYARIVPDPVNSENNTLLYWLKEPNVDGIKGRVQANIYDNNCLQEIYHSSRIFLHSDFGLLTNAPETFDWLTIFEYWNNGNWTSEEYPFRISINMEKRDPAIGSSLFFGIHAQTFDNGYWANVWNYDNSNFPIPFNQWLTIEVYFKEGGNNDGKFYFAITPDGGSKVVIFDITNYTHHPDDKCPNGLTHFNPMKLYTSDELLNYMIANNGILQIYWDDFKLWKNHKP
jgi:hypothetical protein